MSKSSERGQFFGAVVPVRDIPGLRAFYRDVVQLGEPTVDSNFWVEFSLPGGGVLALERRESARAPMDGQGVAWMMAVDNLPERIKYLEERDVRVRRPEQEVPGVQTQTFLDPEGNPFTLYGL